MELNIQNMKANFYIALNSLILMKFLCFSCFDLFFRPTGLQKDHGNFASFNSIPPQTWKPSHTERSKSDILWKTSSYCNQKWLKSYTEYSNALESLLKYVWEVLVKIYRMKC